MEDKETTVVLRVETGAATADNDPTAATARQLHLPPTLPTRLQPNKQRPTLADGIGFSATNQQNV